VSIHSEGIAAQAATQGAEELRQFGSGWRWLPTSSNDNSHVVPWLHERLEYRHPDKVTWLSKDLTRWHQDTFKLDDKQAVHGALLYSSAASLWRDSGFSSLPRPMLALRHL
jgi:hypothetical protein